MAQFFFEKFFGQFLFASYETKTINLKKMDIFDTIEKSKKEKKTKKKSSDKTKSSKTKTKTSKKPKDVEEPAVITENEVAVTLEAEEVKPITNGTEVLEESGDHNKSHQNEEDDGWYDDGQDDNESDMAQGKLSKLNIRKTKTVTVKDKETGVERQETVEVDDLEEESMKWDFNKLDEPAEDAKASKQVQSQKPKVEDKTAGMSFMERMRAQRTGGAGPAAGGPRRTKNKLNLDEKVLKDTQHFPTLGAAVNDKTPAGFTSVVNTTQSGMRSTTGNKALHTSNRFGQLDS